MATSVRTLFRFAIGILTALVGAVTASRAEEAPPPASSQAETLTMSGFIKRIRHDAELRARFMQSPHAVLREFGINPAPINLPDQLTDSQIQRLLNNWTAGVDPPAPSPGDEQALAPAPVYGPPSTPAPVYGPPPTPPLEPPGRSK